VLGARTLPRDARRSGGRPTFQEIRQHNAPLSSMKLSDSDHEMLYDGALALVVALHLTVVNLTCNENGDPDILLLARCHA
jgi:hypothetical protein